jgi:hypothetical protein|tara:strand:+ start:2364 stop:3152 length:789 start_codon:yes stop_codon:yes gene_type:complete
MDLGQTSGSARQGFAPQNFGGETIVKDINVTPKEVERKKHTGSTIDNFKSKMKTFARPNLFEVVIFAKPDGINKALQERLKFSCYQANIPGMSILTTEKDEGYRSIAYQKTYEDITLGFYVHGDMKEIKVFQDWMKIMINPENNHVGYYDDYKSTIEIKNLDRQQKKVLTTTLIDAYPKSIDALTLDADSNDEIMKVNVGFTYRYYKQEFGGKQESVGKGLNDVTPVQRKNLTAGVIDKTLTLKQTKEVFDGTVNEVAQEEF